MITRERPNASIPWLRFQILKPIQRPEIEPVYKGRRVVAIQRTGQLETVFKLIGHGETLEKAELMAKGKI